ncbi:MFS transporter [Streptomyces sp. UNOC14_S4]|uniref:MFS transporter n=1 Tax=Streptomyces sp. UNOC14_S4 TaxID=2872340 RepID=UPI001E2E5157|nr:MFS transporter [Streptomyces sp. UNOC14_S4]MCC3772921.1 MFS transporter [Streptomyces sp. UNOC14_S4]
MAISTEPTETPEAPETSGPASARTGPPGSWRELFGPAHRATALLIAGVMLLDGASTWVTSSLLPTAVEDIGGERLYAWTTTVFMIASVIAALLVSRIVSVRGPRDGFRIGVASFAAGTGIAVVTPTMEVLLAGRVLQGFGTGLLAGLSYVTVQSALPEHLWARGTGLVSATMAAGFFVGPAVGGVFAQFGAWRLAFAVVLVLTLPLVPLVSRAVPAGRRAQAVSPLPMVSLVLLTSAAALISTAGVLSGPVSTVAAVAAALVLIVVFVLSERRPGARARVLPASAYSSGSALRWLYLSRVLITVAASVEAFIPLFGQRLGGLPPVAAGFLGTTLPVGWALTQVAVSGARPPVLARLSPAGPFVLATGLAATGLLQREDASPLTVAAWATAYLVAGSGIGMAMPHLSTAVMGSTTDQEEAAKASAAMNTIGLFAFSFGAALTGVLVNLGAPSMARSARYALFALAAVATLAGVTACQERRRAAALSRPER